MKIASLLIFALLLSTATLAQHAFSLRAGGAYSNIKGADLAVKDAMGYYVGVGYTDIITPHVSFISDVYYLNQHQVVGDLDYSLKSFNLVIGARIFPWQKGLFFDIAHEAGHGFRQSVEGEKITAAQNDPRFSYVLGTGFQVTEDVILEGRFTGAIDNQQQGYRYNAQVGVRFVF